MSELDAGFRKIPCNSEFEPFIQYDETGTVVPPVSTGADLVTLVDTTNLAIATYYYPGATGAAMTGFDCLSLEIDATATGLTTVTITVEGSNDNTFASPKDYTRAGYDPTTNSNGYASIVANAAGGQARVFDFDKLNISYYRVKVVVAGAATNAVAITARRIWA